MSDDLCANVVYINYKQHKHKDILLSNMSLIQKRFLFIKNANLKLCINCVNFIEEKNNYSYDPVPNNKLYGLCKKFGEQDLVTGQIDNAFASVCRMDNAKCGASAKYFEQKLK
jgi:hypothetical protein